MSFLVKQKMVLAIVLWLTIIFNINFIYSIPTDSPKSSSSPLHIETAAGKEAARVLLEGQDYQYEGQQDHSTTSFKPIEDVLPKYRKGKRAGRPMIDPNSVYQKKKAKHVQDLMNKHGYDKETAEKIVLAKWSKERSLAYALKPKRPIKVKASNIQIGKEYGRIKTHLLNFQNRFDRNIRNGMNRDQAKEEAKEFMIDRRERVRQTQKRWKAKNELKKMKQKDTSLTE
jgi:hypothetical protein